MAANVLKVVYSTTDKLAGMTLSPGQLLFLQDDRSIRFVNQDSELVNYQSVVSLKTEAGRVALSHPYPALYWIKDTNVLWRYDSEDGWIQVTTPPKEQLVFGELPEVGEINKIYIVDTEMYRYIDGEFKKIGGSDLNWLPIEG